MATGSVVVIDETFKAGRDLSASQYKGVSVCDSDNNVDIPAAANESPGVLQDKPAASGRPCRVVLLGRTKAYLGYGSLTAGTRVTMAASGWFIGATSGYACHGFVVKTANSGYLGEIFLTGPGHVAANSVDAGQV